jgi:transcriptional regulator with XRE-family HTH domain
MHTDQNNMTFGEKLRDLRKRLKLSQTELADDITSRFPDRIRISQTTLSTLEQRSEPPRDEIIEVLAEYFGVPFSYFSTHESQRIESALAYLETLRQENFPDAEIRAHSSELRQSKDDNIGKRMRNIRVRQDDYGHDEFFDT